MSTNICSYEGCMVRRLPCSSIAFFAIPSDSRRHQWIKNSGNKDLEKLDGTRTRLFCENHFHDSDIRSQFHRKTLRKSAIPVPYKQMSPKEPPAQKGHSEEREPQREPFLSHRELINKDVLENNVITHNDNVIACKFEIVSNEDIEEELVQDIVSHYEEQNYEDDESIENVECEISNEELALDDNSCVTPAYSPIALNDDSGERESRVTTTTMQDFDEISKDLSVDIQLIKNDISTVDEEAKTSCNTCDDDKHFALSLVGYFKRLNHEKKVVAKLKILSYLTALDLGKNADL